MFIGCDPEFFFSKGTKVIGSEKIIEKDGLIAGSGSKIVIDGVQAELNPRPQTCREILANDIGGCFLKIAETLKGKERVKVNFSQVIEVGQKELDSLSESSRVFGCAPSTNIYDTEASKIKVDPGVYRYRSAGGHIHLGRASGVMLNDPKRIVPMLDIILGNTSVLIDRNEWAKERRKVYGKAGEHRLPQFGIEYRTLSNFWLQSYPMMSFVFGMARVAVNIVEQSDPNDKESYENRILAVVNMEDIVKAINENDFDLAYKNFKKIEPVLMDILPESSINIPLGSANIKYFHHFISKGMKYWFKEDPMKHWVKIATKGRGPGWESYLAKTVAKDMNPISATITGWFGGAISPNGTTGQTG